MIYDWNDLKYFLAVYQNGSFAEAARALKVDETTVSRRLSSLENSFGVKLLKKNKSGYLPTVDGEKVLATILPIYDSLSNLQNKIQGNNKTLVGKVTVTMPDTIASHIIIPQLGEFYMKYPDIQIEIITSAQSLNIQKRDADVAIRMFKPSQGTLYAKNIGKLKFSAFVNSKYLQKFKYNKFNLEEMDLIDYPNSEATKEEIKILNNLRSKCKVRLQVKNRYSIVAAIKNGLGIGYLPEFISDGDNELIQVADLSRIEIDTWLVVHSDLKKNSKVRAVADFFYDIMSKKLKK